MEEIYESDIHIYRHEVKEKPNEMKDDSVNPSFGREGIPSLIKQINEDERIGVRQKALAHLCGQLHKPYNISIAIKSEMINILMIKLRKENDALVMEKSIEALSIISSEALSHAPLLELDSIATIAHTLNHDNFKVRYYSHKLFSNISRSKSGVEKLIKAGLIMKIIQSISSCSSENDILLLILTTSWFMATNNPEKCLEQGILNEVVKLVSSKNGEIAVASLRIIYSLSRSKLGKSYLVKTENNHIVSKLGKLLSSNLSSGSNHSISVQSYSVGILANIGVEIIGKKLIVENNLISVLIRMLDHSIDSILLNVMECLICIVSNLEAKIQIAPSLEKFKEIQQDLDRSVAVRSFAEKIISILKILK